MEREGRGWAVGSLIDHGSQFQFYSKATGSLWRVVSRRVSGSHLHFKNIIGLFCEKPARGQLEGSGGHSGARQWWLGLAVPAGEGAEVAGLR